MKKWLIIGVVILVIGGLIGFFAARAGGPGAETPSEGKTETAGTIQVPDGPKIKVVFTGPPELEVSWEKLGMAPDGFQVQVIGTLQNVSNQSVTFSEIGFLFDGYQVDYITGRTLNPGETMKIMKGFPGYSEETKVLEVKVKGFQILGNSTTTPPATIEPAKPTPTQPSSGEKIFTSAPKNPQTPEETVAAFYFFCNAKQYEKAREFWAVDESKYGSLETIASQFFKSRLLTKVEILEIRQYGSSDIDLDCLVYFTNGETEKITHGSLTKIDGKWLVTD